MGMVESMGKIPAATCLICGDEGPGLDIMGQHICGGCEELLLNLPVGGWAYEYFREKIKLIWVG